ncbi:MBL fold metallo-hydrolase [Evansella cellulosilytica]|uniref:Metallo-beta-lactamase domain-containing protein n=1 Tax=Evansella cellulosilytica (strain ATCC 21833 / DSM 2522 / FERM P-1141 / JCM 9156 / N-4) TaxID=649639 RepID=E6TQW8_EVAC2|nr:MBL fold metallo-hydrolase [Evansella cellulosilytica]ADU31743.1 hypothetical protein Bcell_3501 [Evansella cellulosilytica DSM 2522]
MKRTRYKNLDDISNQKSFKDMRRWAKERKAKKKDLTTHIRLANTKDIDELQNNRNKFSITWIGHATFLIQMDGLNVITDPVWAKRMGFQKRMTEPGIDINDLPEIDIVVISHGHYDHLDFGSIKKLKGNPAYYVPIGLGSAFRRRGYKNVQEANWWDDFLINENIKLSFVPAQHWTRRSLRDMNTSHWGGWIIEDNKSQKSVYFVGDTGYFTGFKEIANRFTLDIVLMPIGAYEPEWFMAPSHINPEDAIKAFLELEGNLFIPMHYGAYRLADDTGPEALARFNKEWERLNLSSENKMVLKLGETYWG